jgi:hypothetical protein
MEDLTKQQIILLTLLLSFVTSIGTGIITSSLLEQAPERVIQTINKVVENTVENILPTETTIKETETITNIVIDSDDAVIAAIQKIEKSLVRVLNVAGESQKFSAIGVVIDNNGTVAITEAGFVEDFKYVGQFNEGELALVQDTEKTADGIIFLKPVLEEDEEQNFTAAIISKNSPKLGQSIINVGGISDTYIQTGRVSKILTKTDGEDEWDVGIEISLSSATLGSMTIDYSGRLLGYHSATGVGIVNKQFILAERLIPDDPEVAMELTEDPPSNNNP